MMAKICSNSIRNSDGTWIDHICITEFCCSCYIFYAAESPTKYHCPTERMLVTIGKKTKETLKNTI